MKLSHPNFVRPLVFVEGEINVLIVENQREFYNYIMEMKNQIEEGSGKFVISVDNEILDLKKKVDLTIDILSMNLNQKRIITKLYSILKNLSINEDCYLQTKIITSEVEKYIDEIVDLIDFPITYNKESILESIFKSLDIRFAYNHEFLLERVIDYIRIVREFFTVELFVFVNLKSFLVENDVKELYRFAAYEKIKIILFESTCRDVIKEYENVRIIDFDLCEI